MKEPSKVDYLKGKQPTIRSTTYYCYLLRLDIWNLRTLVSLTPTATVRHSPHPLSPIQN